MFAVIVGARPSVAGSSTLSSSSEMMFWRPRRLAARDLARDFVVTAQAFADTFVQYVVAEQVGESATIVAHRSQETCAAVWASIQATFMSSALSDEEREQVLPLVQEALVPNWRKYRADELDFTARVIERASQYLCHYDPDSQLKTATGLMNQLMDSIDRPAAELLPVRTLTALLAHRMLSDLRRLNEIKAGNTIGH
jgi:hypothetical protein